MSEPVFRVVEGSIRQGALDALKSLSSEMITGTQSNEPGTMSYKWFLDAGKQEWYILGRH